MPEPQPTRHGSSRNADPEGIRQALAAASRRLARRLVPTLVPPDEARAQEPAVGRG